MAAGPGYAGALEGRVRRRLGPGACKQAGVAYAGAALPLGSAGEGRGRRREVAPPVARLRSEAPSPAAAAGTGSGRREGGKWEGGRRGCGPAWDAAARSLPPPHPPSIPPRGAEGGLAAGAPLRSPCIAGGFAKGWCGGAVARQPLGAGHGERKGGGG